VTGALACQEIDSVVLLQSFIKTPSIVWHAVHLVRGSELFLLNALYIIMIFIPSNTQNTAMNCLLLNTQYIALSCHY